jgi:hypothetical protein
MVPEEARTSARPTTTARMHARARRTRVAARLAGRGPGGDRIRTDDPLLAKQALSQLSYAPATAAAAFADPAIGRPTDRAAWAREDLNLRPHAYQACALTN